MMITQRRERGVEYVAGTGRDERTEEAYDERKTWLEEEEMEGLRKKRREEEDWDRKKR